MVRSPYAVPEDVLMLFVTIVATASIALALVAYVGTWLAARLQERRRAIAPADRRVGAWPRPGDGRVD